MSANLARMEDELRVLPGTLLAAWPDLVDPNFMHAVVLIIQHDDEGAFGLVVNKPSDVTTAQLLPEQPDLGRVDFPVHIGGPVDPGFLQFLHTVPDSVPGGFPLDGNLWLGGEVEALGRYVAEDPQGARSSVRMFVGYSGWGSGQLEEELGIGSWLPAPATVTAVFGGSGESTWRGVVRSIGEEGKGLAGQPPDPSWN